MAARRISLHVDVRGTLLCHDVAACAGTPLAVLLPTLVDLVDGCVDDGVHWELRTLAGVPLDESKSLAENDVHDGDVVVLGFAHDPAVGLLAVDPVRVIGDAERSPRIGGARLLEFCWAVLILVVAYILIQEGSNPAPAACCALATAWRAVVVRSTVLAVAGSLALGAAGFLAIPSGPAAPNVLLAAAVVFAATVTLGRLVAGAATALTAVGSAAALVAAVAAGSTAWELGPATAGAVLTVTGFGLLALAPRLAALLTGVQPGHLTDPPADLPLRARHAQVSLSGLVIGSAAAAAAGSVLVALGPRGAPSVAFVLVTAALLFVRVRTHLDAPRRIALSTAGLASTTAAAVLACESFPDRIGWAAVGLTLALGTSVLLVNRPTARVVDAADYLGAALLVPLACWVIGLYAVARNWIVA